MLYLLYCMNFAGSIVPLLTLILMEIILGIDNIIFISILSDKLPPKKRDKLRYWGMGLAMIIRMLLLTAVAWIMKLDNDLFILFGIGFSIKDLILITGGFFLLYKSTREIFQRTEKKDDPDVPKKIPQTFKGLLIQILLLDIIFSIDSIITAVGMVDELWQMYTAIIITVVIMLAASGPISRFIHRHPSFKVLALCFLLMIGIALIAEGLNFKIPKGYIYFGMAFSFMVDFIQLKTHKQT